MSLKIAIVGCGPAGMNAAIEAVRRGCSVTVIDEGARAGGQIFRQSTVGFETGVGLPAELQRKTTLLSSFSTIVDRIDYLKNHTAYALFEGPELHVSSDETSQILKPDVVVLAAGVCERGIPFPGWTLPGVVYAGGAQALLKMQGVKIGQRVVIAGAGPLPIVVAAQLVKAGVGVVKVALLHPWWSMLFKPYALWAGRTIVQEGWQYLNVLRQHNVEVLSRYVPLRAIGQDHIESIQLIAHDGTGKAVPGTEQRIECDALGINYGFTVNSELAAMAGVSMQYHTQRGGWVPVVDRYCRSSLPGILVAGDGAGLRGAWVAQAEGRIAGAMAACYYDERKKNHLERELFACFRERQRHESFQQAVQESLHLPSGVWSWADDDTIVCRCESVNKKRIDRAIAEGHTSMNGIKRNTRVGMGWCGGRMCMQNVAAYIGSGRIPVDFEPMTPRPLARPVSLRALKDQHAS